MKKIALMEIGVAICFYLILIANYYGIGQEQEALSGNITIELNDYYSIGPLIYDPNAPYVVIDFKILQNERIQSIDVYILDETNYHSYLSNESFVILGGAINCTSFLFEYKCIEENKTFDFYIVFDNLNNANEDIDIDSIPFDEVNLEYSIKFSENSEMEYNNRKEKNINDEDENKNNTLQIEDDRSYVYKTTKPNEPIKENDENYIVPLLIFGIILMAIIYFKVRKIERRKSAGK